MSGPASGSALPHVAVVGGGITGLAAAYRLQHLGGVRVTLLEATGRLGGKIHTCTLNTPDGQFLFEAGADLFLSRKPWALDLVRELGIEGELASPLPARSRSYIKRGGRFVPLPDGLSGLVPAALGPLLRSDLLSWRGKLRAAAEPLIPARRDDADESLAQFVERRLGREVYERMAEPLLAGIYGGDGSSLSLAATFPILREAERRHGSLLRGLAAAAPPNAGQPPFLSFLDGMERLPEALAERLTDVDVRLDQPVHLLAPDEAGFRLDTEAGVLHADAVLLTTPAAEAARLLRPLDAEAADALAAIPNGSVATLSLAFRADHVPTEKLDAHGYLIPRTAGQPIRACTWTTSKLPHRAPEGFVVFRFYFGRAGHDDVLEASDDALEALARAELADVLGITASPVQSYLYRWTDAMPQYTLGHLDRVARAERRLARFPGLHLAGCAYRGVGIPDCVRQGESAARAVHDTLHHLHPAFP
ncbi:MAG TPA: protoporphyrinogen oxidase [Rubricoccaceae bacterium]|nr:protoporphyrinogen oxidase [Rubricoccaceae bacterium]